MGQTRAFSATGTASTSHTSPIEQCSSSHLDRYATRTIIRLIDRIIASVDARGGATRYEFTVRSRYGQSGYGHVRDQVDILIGRFRFLMSTYTSYIIHNRDVFHIYA